MVQLSIQIWRKDYLLWFLVGLLIALTMAEPARFFSYPRLVDWPTIGGIAGLLILAKGIEVSGYLHRLGKRLIEVMRTSRSLAVLLVLAAALLSMVLTNDVALFIMVPLTIGLHGIGLIPVTRLIVVEALAVNAGSVLTPIGNPQNLFLWKISGVSFHEYVQAMLPLTLILIASLLVLIAFMFDSNRIQVREEVDMPTANNKLFHSSLILYLPFLILIDLHQTELAVLLILMVFFIRHRSVLVKVDWGLILVLALMFVNMRLISDSHTIHSFFTESRLDEPQRLYFAGIVLAQIMSNVPAAILLADYSSDWKLIAYAVNVGGFGFMLGSLANLIALRLAGDGKAWLIFHAYSLPFLLVTSTLVYLLLLIA